MSVTPYTHWEGESVERWRERLDVHDLFIFESVPSTNDFAAAYARSGAPAGLLVMAEEQTAGRGQAGRTWRAARGSSLLMSVVLRPAGGAAPGALPIRIGLALADALRTAVALDVQVKWPNDLIVAGRGKLGGILCEAVGAGSPDGFVVAGIGINVRQQPDDWPVELRTLATSVDACTATRTDRGALLHAVMRSLAPLLTAPLAPLSKAELERLHGLDLLRGRTFGVGDDPRTWTGAGIANDGALLIEGAGEVHRVVTGTIRLGPFANSASQQAP